MSWILFAILAQFTYSVTNLMDRFLIEKRLKNAKNLSVLGGTMFLFGLVFLIVRGFPFIGTLPTLVLLGVGIFSNVALIPHYKALAKDDASRVIPFYQIIPIIVLVSSYFLFGETLYFKQIIGFAIILFGGYLLAAEKIELGVFRIRKSFWYILLAGIMFSLPAIFFKHIVGDNNFWDATAYELVGTGIGAFLIYLWLDKKSFWAEAKGVKAGTWLIIVLNEIIYMAGIVSMFYALMLGKASLVSVLGGVQPFFLLVLGVILSVFFPRIIKEDISRRTILLKVVSMLIILCGVYFLNT